MREVGVRKWISDTTLLWHPGALEMAVDAGRMELSESEGYWLDTVNTTTERDIAAQGYYVSVIAKIDD